MTYSPQTKVREIFKKKSITKQRNKEKLVPNSETNKITLNLTSS